MRAGWLLGIVGVMAVGAAAEAQTCTASCPVETEVSFDEVVADPGETDFVTGFAPSGYPDKVVDPVSYVYSLVYDKALILDLAIALAGRCPIEVSYSTGTILLASGMAEAKVDVLLTTEVRPVGVPATSTVLDRRRSAHDAATWGTGDFAEDITFSVATPAIAARLPGDQLVLSGDGVASARANGASASDYGSASFDMSPPGQLGQPVLRYCKPF